MTELLRRAREFEAERRLPDSERPAYHLTPPVGWMNDPNGFSVYKGEYHLFFQYHPYSMDWGPMHWGHAKTKDFIHWEYLPAVMAPDKEYDKDGCFSGGAIELPDGRHLLIYTGVQVSDGRMTQTQNLAIGDGIDYEKLSENPVVKTSDIPEGGSVRDFRDPKLWRDPDGTYYIVVGNRAPDDSGQILLYRSSDAFQWEYVGVVDACRNEYGKMWECPDFFPLDGKQVLMASPMEMPPIGLEFHPGYSTLSLIGDYQRETNEFRREFAQATDYGLDFYASQTLLIPDGRRIMVAWMQNWATARCKPVGKRYFGSMTIPRELQIRDGRLIQNPVRELEQIRGEKVEYRNEVISGETVLPGIRGRVLDLTIRVRPADADGYRWFQLNLAQNENYVTYVRYLPSENKVRIDRARCDFPYDVINSREFLTRGRGGELKLRVLLDRGSAELFVNGGEQAASLLIYAPQEADGISFASDGRVLMDAEKYDLL